MNDELTNKLNESGAELLDWMKGAAENGGDFVAEQAPLLATEIVAWHFWSSVFCAGVGVAFVVLFLIAAFVFFRVATSCTSDQFSDGHPKAVLGVIGGSACVLVAAMILGLAVVGNTYEAIKASVAPRIVLIEYAGKALGGK